MDLKALYLCSYGLYVVSSKDDDKHNGQIANTVFQVTAEPPRIAVSLNKENLTHRYVSKSKVFTASILSTDAPMPFIGTWGFKSGRDIDKFKDANFKVGTTGARILLDHMLAYIEAEVEKAVDVGTHTLFIGKVVDCGVVSEGEPMTYAYYHQVKKGKTPEKAATYVKEERSSKQTRPEEEERCLTARSTSAWFAGTSTTPGRAIPTTTSPPEPPLRPCPPTGSAPCVE